MSGRGKSRWNCNNDWVINWWLEIENPPSHQHDDKRKLAFCCCTTSPTPLTLVSHPLRFSFFFPFFFVKTEKFSLPTEEKILFGKSKTKKLVNFSFFHNFSRFPSSTSTVNFSPFALLFLLTTARKARAAQIKLWEKRKFSHREKKSSGAPCWMRFRLVNDYEKWVFEWCCGRIELLFFVVRFASRLFMERFFPSFALSRKIFQRFFFWTRRRALNNDLLWVGFLARIFVCCLFPEVSVMRWELSKWLAGGRYECDTNDKWKFSDLLSLFFLLWRNEVGDECWRDGMWSKTVGSFKRTVQMSTVLARSRLSIRHAQLMCRVRNAHESVSVSVLCEGTKAQPQLITHSHAHVWLLAMFVDLLLWCLDMMEIYNSRRYTT